MQKLKPNEIHFISGGSSKYDVVDLASTVVGVHTLTSLASHTLRITGCPSYNNIYTIIPISIAQIAGAYLGYNIGQYIKGAE